MVIVLLYRAPYFQIWQVVLLQWDSYKLVVHICFNFFFFLGAVSFFNAADSDADTLLKYPVDELSKEKN